LSHVAAKATEAAAPEATEARHRRHPPHSAHADARPHEPTREAAIAGWRRELASSPSFLYGGASGGGPPGKRNGQYRHGERTKAAIAEQRKFGALLKMRSADNAAQETCPVWPGQPMTAHWGVPDPAAASGNEAEVRLAFADTLRMLTNRINIFISLPLRSLDQLTLQRQLDSIGKTKDKGDEPASAA
jgi:hypothetical protein